MSNSVKIFLLAIAAIAFLVFSILFFNRYLSAFEADQACHSEKWSRYSDIPGYGCDHDLETRQWILFAEGVDHKPSEVLMRFRY